MLVECLSAPFRPLWATFFTNWKFSRFLLAMLYVDYAPSMEELVTPSGGPTS